MIIVTQQQKTLITANPEVYAPGSPELIESNIAFIPLKNGDFALPEDIIETYPSLASGPLADINLFPRSEIQESEFKTIKNI